MPHAIAKLSQSADQLEARRVGGALSAVSHRAVWRVECSCGWAEKAYDYNTAKERFELHERKGF